MPFNVPVRPKSGDSSGASSSQQISHSRCSAAGEPPFGAPCARHHVPMPPPLASVVAAFSGAAQERLEGMGWRKRAGDVYTLDRGDLLGWLGLNRATKYEPMTVNPVVGVRHQETEAKVADLRGEKPHPYIPPTISSPIGYLRIGRYYEVTVASVTDAARAADELANLIEQDAHPFIERHLTVAAIIDGLETERLSASPIEYRLPVLLTIAGDSERARQVLDAGVAGRANRVDAEAEQYRAFAAAAQRWIASAG